MSERRAKSLRAISLTVIAQQAEKQGKLTQEALPFFSRDAARLINKLKRAWRSGDMRQRHMHEHDAQSGKWVRHLPCSAAHVVEQACLRLDRNDYAAKLTGTRRARLNYAARARARDTALVAAHS